MKPSEQEKGLTIHQLFEQQAAAIPDAIAVRFGSKAITYNQLNEQANLYANAILQQSPQAKIIGISATRSLELIVGLLAILKSGKAYLPLDASYPKERLQHIVTNSQVDTCVAIETDIPFFESLGLKVISKGDAHTVKQPAGDSQQLACILYTSGSTGKPKGVSLRHIGLMNLLLLHKQYGIATAGTKTLQFCHLSFDASFQEIFIPLITGGTLLIIDDNVRLDSHRLLRFITDEGINRIFLPFVALQYLAEAAVNAQVFPIALQEVITGGESLKVTPQLQAFFTAVPGCDLVNGYGPSETSICVSEFRMKGDVNSWPLLPPIGTPIVNTNIFILDDHLSLLPDGTGGEICISGIGLAEGYLNQPELTAEKFIEWQHPSKGTIRIYRTGDLGRYLPDGNLEFLGRKDDQVKIRGNRVELGEIEIVLGQLPGIQQAVVTAREDVPGQKILVAYLVATGDDVYEVNELRAAIDKKLPDYMMPAAFLWLKELPKTTSGKVDKKALPKPILKRPELNVLYQKPATSIEKKIVALWEALLQLDKVGVKDNFFELGGNSLLAQKTVALLQQEHQYQLPITKLYQYPTAAGIAAFLERNTSGAATAKKKKTSGSRQGDVAVIGMAGCFPGANTIEELWTLLKEGKETTSFFSSEELDPYLPAKEITSPDYVKARGVIDHAKEFDAAFFGINPKVAELMDPQQRVFLEIAWEALERAGHSPAVYSGSIGVFAGSGNNTYYLNNVLGHPQLIDRIGGFQVATLNEKDYIASRTAYQLGLKGPAVSLYSACSTSLLAIAQAAESVRSGFCDVALAGGASVTVPINSGHTYQEGTMLSPDGHCRSFDADAQGTVFSDGAGVVLLKSRESAERDGDTIYAIIKGVGVNNDGGDKGSFTAPSAEGQAGAVAMAIADAAIEPSAITYIEAHGTATPLGDPIEIEGLNIAFGNQEKKQYCAIGSIKSNMGHLTAAAGVAGFIKAVLSLYNKQLLPSINYTQPNPNIDFANSPFFVNKELNNWKAEKRIAGVSSFGVGGTNVHVVLEEFDQTKKETTKGRPAQLISWSAKTAKSSEEYANRLATYLETNEQVELADLAFTLQTTRQHFGNRRFIVATDKKELIEKLKAPVAASDSKQLEESVREVVFLFPGQGSQYVNMGIDLYKEEPVFQQAVDDCAALLKEVMKEDIRAVIYPKKNDAKAEEKLNNTYYTQPALFVIEYALAKLWMSWGIQPSTFIGHSIGEFVAAHLAGVFSLKDGLHLIATRGRLMSELPRGSMLGVRTGHEKIEHLLPADLSLAAINSPGLCVVAGPIESVAAFSKLLEEKNIPNKLLHTSHAFHSSMMDPIVDPFEKVVRAITLKAPSIPIVSTVTGKRMTDADAINPAYWAGHLRSTVRFSDAIKIALGEDANRVMLESGPRNVTATLVRQHGGAAIASLDAVEGQTEYYAVLKALGQLWINGIEPDWQSFYASQKRARLSLPSYAFDRKLLWVDPAAPSQADTFAQPMQTIFSTVTPVANNQTEPPIENKPIYNSTMRKAMLIDKVKEMLEEASGIEMNGVTPDMTFIEMGLDSLLLTQIALTLKKEFNLPITFRQLNEEYSSLDRLATYLEAQLPAEPVTQQAAATVQQQPVIAGNIQPAFAVSTNSNNPALNIISQQLQLLAQQVALLQGSSTHTNGVQQMAAPKPVVIATPAQTIHAQPDLTPEEAAEIKKPFGATARIEKHSSQLTEKQKKFLEELIENYNRKTKGSKAYTQKHRAHMADPRVVSGFRPATKELVYSIVVNKSKGSRIWDVDGNEYIDALNGFGSNMLGYQPEVIKKALVEQIEKGYEIGPQHELAGEVCELICDFTGFDRAGLCNTGSEAVLGAMRIARTVTGRSLIVAFANSYHGIMDEVIVRGSKKLKTFPAASGIMPEAVQNMLILEYGTDESLRIIKERAHELAAVLVEPIQSRRPEFQPVEFLKEVRKITAASGTALVFDEVISGFRFHTGGMQAMFGIKADIGTYGKVAGAGISIGIIAGKKDFMNALDGGFWQFGDDSIPEAGVTYFAGTFVRHPLALATAKASLLYMKEKGQALQDGLTAETTYLANALNAICRKYNTPMYIAHFGSLWKTKYNEEYQYSELLFTLMREKGIHILDGFPCYLTTAHTRADVDQIIQKFEESVRELKEAGFIPEYFDPLSDAATEKKKFISTTESQQEIWTACMIGGEEANLSYNESISLQLKGALQQKPMEMALQEVVNRHEALRSTFSGDGKQLCIGKNNSLSVLYEDLSGDTGEKQQQLIADFLKKEAQTPFDLQNGPLLRVSLFKLSAEEHLLTITAHHIICDGWSFGIILEDLGMLYSAYAKGEAPSSLEIPVGFSKYATEIQGLSESASYKKTEQYWIDQYKDNVPELDLPTDYPRPAQRTYKSRRNDYMLDKELVAGIRKTGSKASCSLVTTLMAAFEAYLHRITGQHDIVLGLPSAGQPATGNMCLVGHCVNLLPLRSAPKGDLSFTDYLKQRKTAIMSDYDHQEFTFGTLLKKLNIVRNPSRVPLVPVVFNIDMGMDERVAFFGLDYKLMSNPREYENFEIFLNATGTQQSLVLEWSYNTQLFKPDTIKRMQEGFESLLQEIVNNPEIKIKDISISDAGLTDQINKWNDTATAYPSDKTVTALINETATKYPDKTAIHFENRQLSYKDIHKQSNQLANYLVKQGIKTGDIIGVALDRSPEMIIALLAVMKSGAAYVPLDPQYPAGRISFMLTDSDARMLITSGAYKGQFESNAKEVLLEDIQSVAGSMPDKHPDVQVSGNDLAYVLYTSGSTGKPKGVQVKHHNLVNFLLSMQKMPGITADDTLLAVTTISFDIAGLELYLPLITGAGIVLTDTATTKDARLLLQLLEGKKVSIMQATPSTWRMLLDAGWNKKYSLKVLCGGEAFPKDLAERLFDKCLSVWNMYGPTETTIWSAVKQLSPRDAIITIGRPIANTQFYIIDEYQNLLPSGIPGEICIGGDGVARGYLNRPELTNEKFVKNPYVQGKGIGATMYRTGDLGKFVDNGEIQCLGRIDHQVKLRGYRIELGEIEHALTTQPGVKEAVVTAREDRPGDQRLVAYVVNNEEAEETNAPSWKERWDVIYEEGVRSKQDQEFSEQKIDVSILEEWENGNNLKQEAAEWLEQSIERIKALQPQTVFEIGSGAGQILFEIAPGIKNYIATDYAESAIDSLNAQLSADPAKWSNVSARTAAADDFKNVPDNSQDLVLIHSVAQYFPTADYLLKVIKNSVQAVRKGGCVFIGDMQGKSSLEMCHAMDQLRRSGDAITVAEFKEVVANRVRIEDELTIDPAFFYILPDLLPSITAVDIQLRKGKAFNETTKYHYDVWLYVNSDHAYVKEEKAIDWHTVNSITELEKLLTTHSSQVIQITNIFNERTAKDYALIQLLNNDKDKTLPLKEIKQQLATAEKGIHPDSFRELGKKAGFNTHIRWSTDGTDGLFEATFIPLEKNKLVPEKPAALLLEKSKLMSFVRTPYSKDILPLSKDLVDKWKEGLGAILPSYMIPDDFVRIKKLPLTSNNKVDRKALPKPEHKLTGSNNEKKIPGTDTEKIIADIWQSILGIEDISIDEDFFELGGHSLIAVQLMVAIEKRTGKRLPMATLFENTTIEKLAKQIHADEEQQWNALVPIKTTGTKDPVYLIHGGGLNVLFYKPIINYLDADQPVYGLQALGLYKEHKPLYSIEEISAVYIADLLKANPDGPYCLTGYSFGGLIAFEMAKQLIKMGKKVKFIGIVDTYIGEKSDTEGGTTKVAKKVIRQFAKIPFIIKSFYNYPKDAFEYQLLAAKHKLKDLFPSLPITVPPPMEEYVEDLTPYEKKIYEVYSAAHDRYAMMPADVKISLLRVTKRLYYIDDPVYLGWKKFAKKGIEIYLVPGDHGSILHAPNDQHFAKALQTALDNAR